VTSRAATEAAYTAGKVNRDTRARLTLDDAAEAWHRALAATAGVSNTITDRTHGILDRSEYDLCYGAPRARWWPTSGVAYNEGGPVEDLLIGAYLHATRIDPVELGGGVLVVGPQPNAESVVERLSPADPLPVNVDAISAYRAARRAAADGQRDALSHVTKSLDVAAAAYALVPPEDVISQLADMGFSQLVMARALGVTPTAVRKWRRGDPPKAEHRGRLASFAALCSQLTEMGLHDPAGWLDIPISGQSTLTPLDLFVAGRADLGALLGGRVLEPQEALDAFDSSWRENYPIDPDYEIVMLRDGSRSAVPRRSGGAR
jgi:hypothetical protein